MSDAELDDDTDGGLTDDRELAAARVCGAATDPLSDAELDEDTEDELGEDELELREEEDRDELEDAGAGLGLPATLSDAEVDEETEVGSNEELELLEDEELGMNPSRSNAPRGRLVQLRRPIAPPLYLGSPDRPATRHSVAPAAVARP